MTAEELMQEALDNDFTFIAAFETGAAIVSDMLCKEPRAALALVFGCLKIAQKLGLENEDEDFVSVLSEMIEVMRKHVVLPDDENVAWRSRQ